MATDSPHVKLRAALLEELQQIPPYGDGDSVDDPYESALLEAHGRSFHGERYYAHPGYEHPLLYAGEHPIIAPAPADPDEDPLQPLSALSHYRIAEDEPNIQGWRFVAGGDNADGAISDVIVDVHALKVRYVAIDLKRIEKVVLVLDACGLSHAIASNLTAIKLLITNIQADAEITGSSAVDIIE